MKAPGIIVIVGLLMAAALAVCLAREYQSCQTLAAQNDTLRQQLSQMIQLTAENQRLTNLLARANTPRVRADGTTDTNAVTDARLAELTQLRGEMGAFQQQSNELVSLRADTRATHDAMKAARQAELASRMAAHQDPPATDGAGLQILEADYGTARTNVDVAAMLDDRIRNGSLKIIASNKLNGDPDFGQVKNLTVVYRFGGSVFTNQFREGSVVVLPPDPSSATP